MQRRTFLRASAAMGVWAGQPTYSVMRPGLTQTPTIINAGIGGNNTVDLLARIDIDCLAQQPELTILLVGTNDMNSRKYVPLADYERNLRAICSKLVAAQCGVMLMTILPAYEPYLMTRHDPQFYQPEGYAARKTKVNETIRKVAAANQFPLLDMHHIFDKVGNVGLATSSLIKNEANSQKTDGIHPTAEGYRVMGVSVYTFLAQQQLLRNRIVCFGDSITFGDNNGQNYPTYLQQLVTA